MLLVFFLRMLTTLETNIRNCDNELELFQMLTSEKDLDLARIMEEVLDLYDIPQFRLVLANQESPPASSPAPHPPE